MSLGMCFWSLCKVKGYWEETYSSTKLNAGQNVCKFRRDGVKNKWRMKEWMWAKYKSGWPKRKKRFEVVIQRDWIALGYKTNIWKKELIYFFLGCLGCLKNKKWSMYGHDRSNSEKLCALAIDFGVNQIELYFPFFYLMSFSCYFFALFIILITMEGKSV